MTTLTVDGRSSSSSSDPVYCKSNPAESAKQGNASSSMTEELPDEKVEGRVAGLSGNALMLEDLVVDLKDTLQVLAAAMTPPGRHLRSCLSPSPYR